MSDTTEVIDRQLEAYNRHDTEAFVGCYAVDAHLYGPDGEVIAAGHDALRAHYAPRFEDHPEVRATITNRIVVGSVVVDHELVTGVIQDGQPIHINAIARHVGVKLDIKDWETVGHKVPLLVNMQPAGCTSTILNGQKKQASPRQLLPRGTAS